MASLTHPIDIGIFVVFLAANLIVGLRYGRRLKNMRDYAIGNKDFSTATLTATIVVSWIGGGDIFYMLKHTYTDGLYFALVIIGAAICLLLIGQLAVRMGEFLNNLSVAEAMGDLYGKTVRILTAVSGVLSVIGVVAIELQVISKMITLVFGVESYWITVLSAAIVILYSISEGIQAVTFTDVFQFLVFGTFMPFLALVIWNNLKDPTQVVQMLSTHPNFSFCEVVGWHPKFLSSLAMFIWFVIPGMDPAVFQRISMSRNVLQAKRSFTYAGMISLFTNLFVIWLGILLLSSDPNLEPDNLFTHIINNYAPVGLRGLIGIGIIALAMSTADSYLNSSAVLLANDIVKPLNITVKRETFFARAFCLFSGVLALLLALHSNDLLKLLLLSNSFYVPIVSVPLLLAILGFRSTARATLIGMGLGFVTVTVWQLLLVGTDSIAPGMLANLIGLMGSHYLLGEKGGWQKLDPYSPLALERAARKQAWQWRLKAIKHFKLYPYLQQNLPKNEAFYFFFGLYTIAATYAAFYTIDDTEGKAYQGIYEGIYRTALFATTAFLTFPIWPPTIKSHRFITFFWPVGIGALLFFAGTLLVIISHFHHMQMMIMMINLLIAVLLLRWPLALFLAFAGTALAVFFFKHYTGLPLPLSAFGSLQFRVIYGLLLFTSFLIALFKSKQVHKRLSISYEQLREEKAVSSIELLEALHHRERLVRTVATDKANAIVTIKQMRKKLDEALKHAKTKKQLLSIHEDFQATLDKLYVLTEHLEQVTYQTQGYMRLEVGTVSLSGLLHDAFEVLNKQNPMFAKQVLTQQHTTCQTLQADIEKLKQLLVDSLRYAQQHKQEEVPILLRIEETSLGYPITAIQGHVKKVGALCFIITTASTLPIASTLPTPSILYMVSVDRSAIRLPKDATELPITHNQQIVEAHYGTSEFIESEQGMTQIYVIPVRVRDVRPQTMDLLSTIEVMPDTAIYPEETAFVKEVTEKTKVDMAMLQQALQLIKQYHAGVKRKSGEAFYLHPIAVARILLDYTQDQNVILSALLHDTVEDTSLSLAQVALRFNPVVKRIVDGVTHLDSNLKNSKRIQLSAHENIQQLLEVKDERILYVKLADRLHNMRTIDGHASLAKQQKIAAETLQFFVPMAKSLGLTPIAEELKERSFEVLNRK